MDDLRAFIAIDIPPGVKTEILKIQARLRNSEVDASWVHQDNFHITLKFLGNFDPQIASRIVDELNVVFSPLQKFSLSLGGFGVFPDQKDPQVIWIDVQDPNLHLERLWEISEGAMSELKFPIESRRYVPHITLGYIKSQEGIERLKGIMNTVQWPEYLSFEVSSVKLYQSQLTPEGSIYKVLADITLNG